MQFQSHHRYRLSMVLHEQMHRTIHLMKLHSVQLIQKGPKTGIFIYPRDATLWNAEPEYDTLLARPPLPQLLNSAPLSLGHSPQSALAQTLPLALALLPLTLPLPWPSYPLPLPLAWPSYPLPLPLAQLPATNSTCPITR